MASKHENDVTLITLTGNLLCRCSQYINFQYHRSIDKSFEFVVMVVGLVPVWCVLASPVRAGCHGATELLWPGLLSKAAVLLLPDVEYMVQICCLEYM